MDSINVTNARQNLYKLIGQINETHRPVQILSKGGNAILLSEEDYRALAETVYLSSIPGLTASLKDSLTEPLDQMIDADELEW